MVMSFFSAGAGKFSFAFSAFPCFFVIYPLFLPTGRFPRLFALDLSLSGNNRRTAVRLFLLFFIFFFHFPQPPFSEHSVLSFNLKYGCPYTVFYSFSALRSLALRLRGFSSSSFSPGSVPLSKRRICGFFPQTHTGKSGGQVQPFAKEAKVCLVMRSSREF